MWIGSPLRGAFRLLSYLLITLPLLPFYLLALALGIQPIVRWMPVAYHAPRLRHPRHQGAACMARART